MVMVGSSLTELTVTLMTWVVVYPALSVKVSVKLSLPLKLALGA